jgi:hypothetical protein
MTHPLFERATVQKSTSNDLPKGGISFSSGPTSASSESGMDVTYGNDKLRKSGGVGRLVRTQDSRGKGRGLVYEASPSVC